MKKSTKSVLAAGAAVVVLTGGAGSLAYWNATADIDGGEVESGELGLELADGEWNLNGTPVQDPGAEVVLVPGDVLNFYGDYTVSAVGNNIQGAVTTDGGATGSLEPFLDTQLDVYDADYEPVTTVDGGDDGETLYVDLVLSFPFGSNVDNTSQEKVVDLSDVSVVLTQTDATP